MQTDLDKLSAAKSKRKRKNRACRPDLTPAGRAGSLAAREVAQILSYYICKCCVTYAVDPPELCESGVLQVYSHPIRWSRIDDQSISRDDV